MGAYNPAGYHNGSVWPHDTALAIAGLMRYGFAAEAQKVASGLVDAASSFSGRLPELFCGFDRSASGQPVPYPTSCSPQAWASAAPVAVLVAMLGLEPDVPAGRLALAPSLPAGWGAMQLRGIPIGGARVSIDVDAHGQFSAAGAEELDIN